MSFNKEALAAIMLCRVCNFKLPFLMFCCKYQNPIDEDIGGQMFSSTPLIRSNDLNTVKTYSSSPKGCIIINSCASVSAQSRLKIMLFKLRKKY